MEKHSSKSSNLIKIVKNTGLGIGGRVVSMGLKFVTTVLITRTIGAQFFGIYSLSRTVIVVANSLALLGLEPGMIKFVAQYKAEKNINRVRGVIAFGIVVVLITGTILLLGIFFAAESISNLLFHNPEITPVLQTMTIGIPVISLTALLLAALQGAKIVKYKILVQDICKPLSMLILILLAFWFGYEMMGVVWAWIITAIVGLALSLVFIKKETRTVFVKPLIEKRREIFSFSLPLLFTRLFNTNIKVFGVFILAAYYPAEQIGIYAAAFRVVPILEVPLVSFNAIFAPIIADLFARNKMKELENMYKIGSRWVVAISVPLFILILFFSEQIVLVFGNDFVAGAQLLIVLLVGQMVNSCTGSTGFMLSMTGKPLYNLFNAGILCLLNIALTLLFIPKYGALGAAYAYSVSITIMQLLQLGEVWYLYKVHPYSVDHLKPVLCGLAAFFILFIANKIFIEIDSLLSILILLIIFLFTYIMILISLGLSPDDRFIFDKIRQKIQKGFNKKTGTI